MDHPIVGFWFRPPKTREHLLHGWAFDNIYLTIADVKISEVIRQIGSWILWSKMMAWRIPPKKLMAGTWKFNPFFRKRKTNLNQAPFLGSMWIEDDLFGFQTGTNRSMFGSLAQVPGASRWRLSTWELPEDDKWRAWIKCQRPAT